MPRPYLEITYRQGKPFAAYLYLERRPGDKVSRTQRHGEWMVDLADDGRALGIEFIHVGKVDLAALNAMLQQIRQPILSMEDIVPLNAA